jgi:serine/threonine-protein kinase
MYEMLAGTVPFTGENAVAIAYKQVHEDPTPLDRLNKSIPIGLAAIVTKCMAKSPDERYSTAGEVRDDLRRFVDGLPVLALTNRVVSTSNDSATHVLPITQTDPNATTVIAQQDQPTSQIATTAPRKPATMTRTRAANYPPYDDFAPKRTAGFVFGSFFAAMVLLVGGLFLYQTVSGSSSNASITVPDVRNLTVKDASEKLIKLGFTPVPLAEAKDGIGNDIVYSQDPKPSVLARNGDTIIITYNPAGTPVVVPLVRGLTVKEATGLLAPLGLQLAIAEVRNDPKIPENQIIGQDPKVDTQVRSGSTIAVIVSGGVGEATVPNIQGQISTAALQFLQSAPYNFIVTLAEEANATIEKGRVIRTEPAIGEPIAFGSPIIVFISKGGTKVAMPQVEGLTEADARAQLTAVGLTPDVKYQEVPSGNANDGKVVTQGTDAGTQIEAGSSVRLTVGRGVVTP